MTRAPLPSALAALLTFTACGRGDSAEPAAPGGAPAPGAPAPAADAKAPAPRPAIAADAGKRYRHPLGLSLWYPADWTLQDKGQILLLTPPDPGSNADGPTEAYVVFGESVAGAGIATAADPKVGAYLDGQLKGLAPFLRRSGATGGYDLSRGKGAVYAWEGKNPKGNLVLARAYVAVFDDTAVALAAIGLKDRIDAREPAVRKTAASFGFGKGDLDPALARSWRFASNVALSNNSVYETAWSRANLASETTSTLDLRADGTWTRTDVSQGLAGAGGVWIETGGTTVKKGRWNAGNGTLYLMYDDDSWTIYQYKLEGATLRLASGNKGEVWQAK
jgi:hypothetical protein